jgi:integrase
VKIAAITPEHVAALNRDLEKKGLSAATITDYTKPLSGTLAFALRRGLIATNPYSVLTRDDRPRPKPKAPDHVWSDDEMDALIEASERLAKLPQARYDYTPLLRLALYTGLRLGELLGLQWQDIDLHEGELHVRRQWTRMGEYAPTKSNAGVRRVPSSPDVVKFLAAFKLISPFSGDDEPVFASKSGKPLGHRNVTRRGSEPAIRAAGIEGVSIHDLRHAFASRMISRGVEPVTLASLMGHEDARITLSRYAHVYDKRRTDEAVRQAMAR